MFSFLTLMIQATEKDTSSIVVVEKYFFILFSLFVVVVLVGTHSFNISVLQPLHELIIQVDEQLETNHDDHNHPSLQFSRFFFLCFCCLFLNAFARPLAGWLASSWLFVFARAKEIKNELNN